VISEEIITDITSLTPRNFYSDDATPDTVQCTGDAHEYGASGVWIDDPIPNTDPGAAGDVYHLTGRAILYYLAPHQQATQADRLDLETKNPLQVRSVTPWEEPTCSLGAIQPIQSLRALKDGADVLLSWNEDANADGYNVWWVDRRDAVSEARAGGSGELVTGCDDVTTPGCTDVGAVGQAQGARRFYQTRGVCAGVEAPE
jgi:hypothetical protein